MNMTKSMGSFSFDVTKRILDALSKHGRIKKTNLATKTGLNYNVCRRYIRMLKILEWLNEAGAEISVTELGRQVCGRLLQDPHSLDNEQGSSKKFIDSNMMLSLARKPRSRRGDTKALYNSRFDPQRPQRKMSVNIMLVDDEEDVALTYESFLFSTGYFVETYSESYKALRDFALDPLYFDLVILDIRMENINGLQLYQSFKAMNPNIKALFVTSLDAAKELVSIIPGISPEYIIRKPVERQRFINSVRKVLGGSPLTS
jgi:CheY-like chemotaxis protein/predicted transcriptional regulator